MSEKRFKTMKEVNDYLEKQMQFDYLTRFDVYLEEDYIFDNETKKRYSFKNTDVNLALWEVIRDLSEESASLDDENARLLSERIKDLEYFEECVNKAKELKEENKKLEKKITPSIYNKKDGDWKWNVDNNTILNIRTGEIFYLRNSGAVENLVGLLNNLHQENNILNKNEDDLGKCTLENIKLKEEKEQLHKVITKCNQEIAEQNSRICVFKKQIKELKEKNKQLKEEIRAYPINEEYAEEIMKQNKNLRIEKIDLQTRNKKLKKENEQLRKKLECCEYSHFLNELDTIHEKVDEGDLSDFNPLKEDEPLNDYNPLKNDLYYWQCKYFKRDYEHKIDMCTRCNWGGLLNYCLKDKCDKMVKKDYEGTVIHYDDGVSIGWKKRGV